MTDDAGFYDRALNRIDRLAILIAPVFVIVAFAILGWRNALGCAIGCILSFVNLKLWKRVASSIATGGSGPSAATLGLRYLLLGCIIFVIIKYFEVSLLAVLAGLLVSVAAVVLEILYELISASHSA